MEWQDRKQEAQPAEPASSSSGAAASAPTWSVSSSPTVAASARAWSSEPHAGGDQGVATPRGSQRLLALLVAFQYFHWFEPSQPYLTEYVFEHYSLSPQELQRDVFAYDIPFFFTSMVLITGTYLVLGERVSLLLCAAASIGSPLLILYSNTKTGVLLSQLTWTTGFTAIFLVTAILLMHLPRNAYLKAAGYSSAAMMLASLTSDFIGFGLAMRYKNPSYLFTFYLTLASSSVAVLIILLGAITGIIPGKGPRNAGCPPASCDALASVSSRNHLLNAQHDDLISIASASSFVPRQPPPGATAAAGEAGAARGHSSEALPPPPPPLSSSLQRAATVAAGTRLPSAFSLLLCALRHRRLLVWLLSYAVLRSVHTVVITLWPVLVLVHDHKHVKYNGLVGGVTYALATVIVVSLQHVPPLHNAVRRLGTRSMYLFCAAMLLGAGAFLAGVSRSRTIVPIALCLVGYHAVTESYLVIAASFIGKYAQHVFVSRLLPLSPVVASGADGSTAAEHNAPIGSTTTTTTTASNTATTARTRGRRSAGVRSVSEEEDNEAAADFARDEALTQTIIATSRRAHDVHHNMYLLLMASRFAVTLVVQTVLQLIIWPSWGTLDNIFGVHLRLGMELLAYAGALLCAAAVLAAVAAVVFAMRTTRGSQHTAERTPLIS